MQKMQTVEGINNGFFPFLFYIETGRHGGDAQEGRYRRSCRISFVYAENSGEMHKKHSPEKIWNGLALDAGHHIAAADRNISAGDVACQV